MIAYKDTFPGEVNVLPFTLMYSWILLRFIRVHFNQLHF